MKKKLLGEATKRRCFKCQGIGHLQVDWPNRKATMYISDQLIELENAEDELEDNQQGGDDVNDNIYLDDVEFLVIQKSLHTDLKIQEPWQREALFHTGCTS